MTLVSPPHWPSVLVLTHVRGQGVWPFCATKLFRMITLGARGCYAGLEVVQVLAHKAFSGDRRDLDQNAKRCGGGNELRLQGDVVSLTGAWRRPSVGDGRVGGSKEVERQRSVRAG